MQTIIMTQPEIQVIGIATRTHNVNERDPSTAKIGSLVQHYFSQNLSDKIPNRKKPGRTFIIYTEYESDFTGDYTCLIGEEVNSFESVPAEFNSLIIPSQTYTKITSESGPLPDIVIKTWQKIWSMTPQVLGGIRGYKADFEIYDERASDYKNAIVDVYIGIEKI